jgi:hypothetical protein
MNKVLICIVIISVIAVCFILYTLLKKESSKLNILYDIDFSKYGVGKIQKIIYDGTNIWFIDTSNDLVICLQKSDGSVTKLSNENSSYNFSGISDIAFDGDKIWVTNSGNNSVTCFKASDRTFIMNLSDNQYTFSNPKAISFDSNNTNMYVANYVNNSLTCFKSSDGKFIKNIKYEYFNAPYDMSFNSSSNNMWVLNAGTTSMTGFKVTDESFIKKIANVSNDNFLGIASDGANIWVINDNTQFTGFKASDGSIFMNIKYKFDYPTGIAPCGENMCIIDKGKIIVFNPRDGSIVSPITDKIIADKNLSGIAFDGQNIWIGYDESKILCIKITDTTTKPATTTTSSKPVATTTTMQPVTTATSRPVTTTMQPVTTTTSRPVTTTMQPVTTTTSRPITTTMQPVTTTTSRPVTTSIIIPTTTTLKVKTTFQAGSGGKPLVFDPDASVDLSRFDEMCGGAGGILINNQGPTSEYGSNKDGTYGNTNASDGGPGGNGYGSGGGASASCSYCVGHGSGSQGFVYLVQDDVLFTEDTEYIVQSNYLIYTFILMGGGGCGGYEGPIDNTQIFYNGGDCGQISIKQIKGKLQNTKITIKIGKGGYMEGNYTSGAPKWYAFPGGNSTVTFTFNGNIFNYIAYGANPANNGYGDLQINYTPLAKGGRFNFNTYMANSGGSIPQSIIDNMNSLNPTPTI